MSLYNESFFNGTTGLIQNILLTASAQEICNRKFNPSGIETDYYSNSIAYGVGMDNVPNGLSQLDLVVNLPIAQQTGLTDSVDLAARITSVTSQVLDSIPFSHNASYPSINDYPMETLPSYLTGGNPTLERRLVWLCTSLMNLTSWLEEWNFYSLTCEHFINASLGTETTMLQRAGYIRASLLNAKIAYLLRADVIAVADTEQVLTDYTNHLILELDAPIRYRFVPEDYTSYLVNAPIIDLITVEAEITGTESESNYLDPVTGNSNDVGSSYSDYIGDSGGSSSTSIAPQGQEPPIDTLPEC